ncbi:hypothetical protein J416_11462 [Gracilibacillus halophilus YIM-C55.5]|uniref:CBS domain-containing protein n=1 Tax=Gracilibacillus halophilus YIM-C55.5 TaxID=1308866 RepID=N4WJH3_9BACI|nr:DUF294 nucleotidyltransferase-like domain-containing protein [Gracilibacillus halophilus]ENH96312.1 hypothetical protein J416_11462 [Gracilibacillus halophilus YIM-C55.5]
MAASDQKEWLSKLMTYDEVRRWRNQYIQEQQTHEQLNTFHDQLMKQVFVIARKKIEEEQGPPPAPFAFFLMGSAGRCEQSIWSDQDHGIIFDGHEQSKSYFLTLGEEMVYGLEKVGYERCDGKVMASESMWTQSLMSWKKQVVNWLEESSWQSLRHFSTLFDSRVLIGERELLSQVKQKTFAYLDSNPHLYLRCVDNVGFIRKGIGIFGQLLPEQSGTMAGKLNVKTTTVFPYVNAMRLLAILRHEEMPATKDRIKFLTTHYPFLQGYLSIFERLLAFRYRHTKQAADYDHVHHISLKQLSKRDKQELKQFMKDGVHMFEMAKKMVEKECSKWL